MAKGEAHQAGNLQAACIWRRAVKGAFPPRPRRIALYLRAVARKPDANHPARWVRF